VANILKYIALTAYDVQCEFKKFIPMSK